MHNLDQESSSTRVFTGASNLLLNCLVNMHPLFSILLIILQDLLMPDSPPAPSARHPLGAQAAPTSRSASSQCTTPVMPHQGGASSTAAEVMLTRYNMRYWLMMFAIISLLIEEHTFPNLYMFILFTRAWLS